MIHYLTIIATVISIALGAGASQNESNWTQTEESNTSKNVYFSLIYHNIDDSSGALHALNMALKKIEDQELLPGYNLTYETPRKSMVFSLFFY